MIYRRIREERIGLGLTLDQLSARTGVAAPNLSRLEQGRVDARLSTIARVLLGLGFALELVPERAKSVADVIERMEEGSARLRAAALGERDVEARLTWKEERGLDTTVERRVVGGSVGPG